MCISTRMIGVVVGCAVCAPWPSGARDHGRETPPLCCPRVLVGACFRNCARAYRLSSVRGAICCEDASLTRPGGRPARRLWHVKKGCRPEAVGRGQGQAARWRWTLEVAVGRGARGDGRVGGRRSSALEGFYGVEALQGQERAGCLGINQGLARSATGV